MSKQEPQQTQYAQMPQNISSIQEIRPGISGWLMCFLLMFGMIGISSLGRLYTTGVELAPIVAPLTSVILFISALASISLSIATVVLISLRKRAGRALAMMAAVANGLHASLFEINMTPKAIEDGSNSTNPIIARFFADSQVPEVILSTQIVFGIVCAFLTLIVILYFALSKRVKVTLVE